jgi:branched-chain amino acid transport system permease protein
LGVSLVVLAGPAGARQPAPTGESIGGTIRKPDGKPVPNVTLTVHKSKLQVGTGTTGPDGQWTVPVPGPGIYQVLIDTSTLPKGVKLADPARRTLDQVEVRPEQAKVVLFPLGGAGGATPSRVSQLLNLALDGVRLGVIVALAAVGLSLIFGVTGLVNFAHGELVTFGAVVAFFFSTSVGGPRWPLAVATVLAVGVGGGFGWVLEMGLWRPLRRRRTSLIALLVVSIGLSLLIRHVILVVFKGDPRSYAQFAIQHPLHLGAVSILPKNLAAIGLSLGVLVAVGLVLERTRLGTAMRAVADNKDLAESSGIDVERVILATWVFAGSLAALGGVLYGLTQQVVWDMGFTLLLTMFAAVILGGLGSAYGAIAGGLVIGVASELSTYWIEVEFKVVVSLMILILVLLFRPQGILGIRERVG